MNRADSGPGPLWTRPPIGYGPGHNPLSCNRHIYHITRHIRLVRPRLSWIGLVSLSASGRVRIQPLTSSMDWKLLKLFSNSSLLPLRKRLKVDSIPVHMQLVSIKSPFSSQRIFLHWLENGLLMGTNFREKVSTFPKIKIVKFISLKNGVFRSVNALSLFWQNQIWH